MASTFKFYLPIQVRFSDLDPQWHVNNARFVSFIEQARFAYLIELGLFDGKSFFDLGLIVADVHIAYMAPIKLTQSIRVGCRVSRIGTKSMTFEYQIEVENSQEVVARGETVMVAYDYHTSTSIPVPDNWREKIGKYEGIS
ncbi:MAG TPA: thioesterase family protein [Longilinea sp.]|nr:thioesterase family protein [Longilinea sp.]